MKTEFDVSDVAWETYRLMYNKYFPNGLQIFDDKLRKYIYEQFAYRNKISEKIKFSGETDFNFTNGWAHSRLQKYQKAIKTSSIPVEYSIMYSNNLEILKKLNYSIVNISLIPETGNLQSAKQGIGNDRLDTFIWALDQYYNGKNIIMNHSSYDNAAVLENYLNLFGNVNDYCRAIYHINESLVDDLIISGSQPINTPERIICFMNLAIRFWNQKISYLSSHIGKKSNLIFQKLEEISTLMNELFKFESLIKLK